MIEQLQRDGGSTSIVLCQFRRWFLFSVPALFGAHACTTFSLCFLHRLPWLNPVWGMAAKRGVYNLFLVQVIATWAICSCAPFRKKICSCEPPLACSTNCLWNDTLHASRWSCQSWTFLMKACSNWNVAEDEGLGDSWVICPGGCVISVKMRRSWAVCPYAWSDISS